MATAQASKRDASGQHFVLQLLGATGGQLAPKQSADFARFNIEYFAQDFCVVSVSGQTRLRIVEVLGQDGFDYLDGYRLLPNLEPFFEGPIEVGLKLERRTESRTQQSHSIFGQHRVDAVCRRRLGFFAEALREQPCDVA